jgi:murein DD-endopeptidase MepM/ murein hydrolase activator NlpD
LEKRVAATLDGSTPAFHVDPALTRFAVAQRDTRAVTPEGAPMPKEAHQAWAQLFSDLDTFLKQPAEKCTPLEVIRARVALDAELDMDRSRYDQISLDLVAAVRARILGLERRLTEVRRLSRMAAPPPSWLLWPLEPVVVTSLFGDRTDPFDGTDRLHRGVDLRASIGQRVQASAEGVVRKAGRSAGHGLHVEIIHRDGVVTGYSHLSKLLVSSGMHVPAKGTVGLAGSTGRSTGPHLHFEVWRAGEPLDPLSLLDDPAEKELGETNLGSGD